MAKIRPTLNLKNIGDNYHVNPIIEISTINIKDTTFLLTSLRGHHDNKINVDLVYNLSGSKNLNLSLFLNGYSWSSDFSHYNI